MTYSFIYSPRKDTPAAAMDCQIPDGIKGERMNRLLEVQNVIALEKNKPLEGKILKVLCDGKSKNNEKVYMSRTENNRIVHFESEKDYTGQFINVHITRGDTFALYGEI
jgi:tRNA-2-methylthio-N6-dimethylallyladenosine synthase